MTLLAAIAAVAAAVAAWRSAHVSALAVRRANLPFVWPTVCPQHEDSRISVSVRLHNDGPGLAQDVVAARLEPSDDEHPWSIHDRTSVIRAMREGETLPPNEADCLSLGAHVTGDDVFAVVVRWTDTAGQRWELVAPQDPYSLTAEPRPLRRRRWQRWRPPADW